MTGSESVNTCLNQVSYGLKKLVSLGLNGPGGINLDWGGGKYDKGTEYLKQYKIINVVYDLPPNRTEYENEFALQYITKCGGAESGTLLNVLNVIPTKEERLQTVSDVLSHLRDGAKLLITVYTGDGSGILRSTTKGWQMNQPLSFYQQELEEAKHKFDKVGRCLILTK